MSKLRQKLEFWLLPFFLLLLVGALTPHKFLPDYVAAWLQDAGHIALGAATAALLSGVARLRTGKYNCLWIWGITAIILLAIELVQIPLQREASLIDLLVGMCGAASLLLLMASAEQQKFVWKRRFLLFSAIMLLLALSPLLYTSAAYVARDTRFPVLANFSSELGKVFLRPHGGEFTQQPMSIEGETFPALLCMQPGNWPGISIDDVAPDWRGYEKLSFVLYSDFAEPVGLNLRVHDKQHSHDYNDRYNHGFNLQAGINRIEIMLDDIKHAPVSREMDMRSIQGIILFAPDLDRPACVRLGALKLL